MSILVSLKSGSNTPSGAPVRFHSTQHSRYQGGIKQGEEICNRGIQIEPNIHGQKGYSVTIHNLDGLHPVWGDNVQMATKPMEVISVDSCVVELRGYGYDERAVAMGFPPEIASFSDYGLVVQFSPSGEIEKCTLILHDRGVRIEYI